MALYGIASQRRSILGATVMAMAMQLLTAPDAIGAATIHVGSMYEYIAAEVPLADKDIRNTGDSTAYVRVDIVELDKGGTPLASPGKADDGLLASPARMIIPADGSQRLRLIALGSRDRERYFRVRIVPVAPTREHGFAPSEKSAARKHNTALEVLIGYGVLVTSAPTKARFDTQIQHDAGALHVTNRGNSTIYLRDYRICRQDNGHCGPPQDLIVPPGQHTVLQGSDDAFHRFDLQEASERRRVEPGRR